MIKCAAPVGAALICYAKALKQKKMQAEGITANERLGYLRADFNAGLLTQEEFDNELEEILQGEDWETVSEAGEEATSEEDGKRQHSFGGINSPAADGVSLQTAKEMKESGVSANEIFEQTGWYVGKDGKWRFEIDTSNMSLKIEKNIPNYTTLGELIDAPKLFAAYPDLADVGVTFQRLGGESAHYNRQLDDINVDYSMKSDPEDLLDILTHEIQHAIQVREGFTRGASPKYWEREKALGFDARTEEVRTKGKELQERYDEIKRNEPEFFADMQRLVEMTPNVPRGEINWDTLEQIEDDPLEWQRYDAERAALESKYGEEKVFEFDELVYDLKRSREDAGRTATELYYNTAGEIEAREAETRRKLTEEERRLWMPNRGNEDTVFSDGSMTLGYMASSNEGQSIKEQLRSHQEELNAMEPVATVTGKSKKGAAPGVLRKEIIEKLRPTGFKVERMKFGEIIFDEKRLNTSLNYLDNDADAIAYQAIPQVLKRGKMLGGHENHKDRNYSTITIAAPVVINGKRGNMAVVVKKTGKNYYKMHRVLTPDGKVLEISEKEMQSLHPAEGVTVSGSLATPISSASVNSISDNRKSVNRQYSYSSAQKKTAEEQRAAVEWLQENLAKGEIPSARAELDSKATNVLNSAEAKLTRVVAKAFGIRGNEARQTLRQYAADLAEEYLYFGMVSEHTMQQMFDTVWQTATRDNSEFIAQYEEVKAYLNKNGVSVRGTIGRLVIKSAAPVGAALFITVILRSEVTKNLQRRYEILRCRSG